MGTRHIQGGLNEQANDKIRQLLSIPCKTKKKLMQIFLGFLKLFQGGKMVRENLPIKLFAILYFFSEFHV